MFAFNLKSMLTMSKSAKKVLHQHKRFKLGKFYYAVQYDLIGTSLIIKKVKKTKRTPKIERNIRRRSDRLNRFHSTYMSTTSESSSDPSTCTTVISAMEAKPSYENAQRQIICNDCAIQTVEEAAIQQNTTSTDSSDLTIYNTRAQQTSYNSIEKSLQTDKLPLISTSVQAKCDMTNIFTNTDMRTTMAGTQTERYSSHCYVQTDNDYDYEEFADAKPKALLFKIYTHLITQSVMLRNSNRLTEQLLELRQLDNVRFQILRPHEPPAQKQDTKAPLKPEIKKTNKMRAKPKYKLAQRTKIVRFIQKLNNKTPEIAEIEDNSTQTDLEQSEKSTQTLKKRGGFFWHTKEPKID